MIVEMLFLLLLYKYLINYNLSRFSKPENIISLLYSVKQNHNIKRCTMSEYKKGSCICKSHLFQCF